MSGEPPPGGERVPSRVVKADGFRWAGVAPREYAAPNEEPPFRDVVRHVLLGDGEGEARLRFVTRYFEIAPGGWSSLEHHGHPHAVVVLRGRGEVLLDGERHALAPHDVVYVAPWSVHQFRAAADAPLGFLCMVDRERDPPVRLGAAGSPAP